MKTIRRWIMRIAGALNRTRRERELADEIESHLQLQVDDNLARGMSPDEARRAAVLQLGSAEALKEAYREQRGLPFVDHAAQDLKYAGRALRRSPGFTAVAVITIAFGVAGPVVIFTMAKAWILEPLPFDRPTELLDIRRVYPATGERGSLNPADFLDFRQRTRTLRAMAAYRDTEVRVTGGDRAERVRGADVTANFFDLLGARAATGRFFAAGEDAPGAPRVAVISEAIWRERFQSDPAVEGRAIRLDGRDHTIVGVVPSDFQFTLVGRVDIWRPLVLGAQDAAKRAGGGVMGVGRLAGGRSVDQARHELTRIAAELAAAHPDTNAGRSVRVIPLADEVRVHHDMGFIVPVLFAMVGCVLLIACVNVTNVMLARASTRRREMAVRLALGASRARIVRQWLVEHVVLFLVASLLGAGMAVYGAAWITNSIPVENRQYLRNHAALPVDAGVLLFAVAVGIVCGVVFGWIPAWTGSRANVSDDLRDSSGRTTMTRATARLRSGLVVAEVALALALLISAGLLVQTAKNIDRIDVGFDTARLLTFRLALDEQRYAAPASIRTFYARLVEDLAARPGVAAAAAGSFVPFSGVGAAAELFVEPQRDTRPSETPWTAINHVTAGYGRAIGLHLRAGRFLQQSDDAEAAKVAVVNETLAERHLRGRNPLGARVRLGRESTDVWTVVGVVADVKNDEPTDRPEPQIYVPLAQSPRLLMTVVVKATGDPESLAPAVRASVAALDAAEPVSRVFTMSRLMAFQVAGYSTIATFITFFGALTLLLAGVGVYGVIAYTFAQRTREIGLRMALGADARGIFRLVLGEGAIIIGVGTVMGLAGATLLRQTIEAQLYGTGAMEPTVVIVVSGILVVVALLATAIPARRAARTNPTIAMTDA